MDLPQHCCPPLAEVMLTSTPVLGLVQDVPTPTIDRNAFQELDHMELFAVCSKWTCRITDPARAVEYVDRAIDIALSGRPGPVVLMLPKDVLISSLDEDPGRPAAIGGRFPLDRPRADRRCVAEASQLIAHALRPLIVAGGGVNRSGAADVLARLQELAAVPVATTNMGKGAVRTAAIYRGLFARKANGHLVAQSRLQWRQARTAALSNTC